MWLCCVDEWLVVGYWGPGWRYMLGFGVSMLAGVVKSVIVSLVVVSF